MKTPPVQYTDEQAHNKVEDFITGKIELVHLCTEQVVSS